MLSEMFGIPVSKQGLRNIKIYIFPHINKEGKNGEKLFTSIKFCGTISLSFVLERWNLFSSHKVI